MKITVSTPKEAPPQRLDHLIAAHFQVSLAAAQRYLQTQPARLAGKRLAKGTLIPGGQQLELDGAPERPENLSPVPQPELTLSILYQDEALVAVEKPSGVPTHPLRAKERGTLANALVARFPECAASGEDLREVGLAHRLDSETSGILLAARSREVFLLLRSAFSRHDVQKSYLAVIEGTLDAPCQIDWPLAHDPKNQRKMLAVSDPRLLRRLKTQEALTEVEALAYRDGLTLVRAVTSYGRMHQIRAHLSALGTPLAGDTLYGAASVGCFGRSFFLHAATLSLHHPVTAAALRLETATPAILREHFAV